MASFWRSRKVRRKMWMGKFRVGQLGVHRKPKVTSKLLVARKPRADSKLQADS